MEGKQVRDFNLKVLKFHDPNILDIMDQTTFVVVYKFEADEQAWTKPNIAGTGFVVERSTEPFHQFFILNRHGIENFVVSLVSEEDVQTEGDFLHYQDDNGAVWGLWIFEGSDRDRIGENLLACARNTRVTRTMTSPPSEDVLTSLFRKATEVHRA